MAFVKIILTAAVLLHLVLSAALPQIGMPSAASLDKGQTTTLFTPPLVPLGKNELECYLVNVSDKTREVTIQAFTRDGVGLEPVKTTLKPGVEGVAKASADQTPRYCKFVVAGKRSDFRASILVFDPNAGSISALSAE